MVIAFTLMGQPFLFDTPAFYCQNINKPNEPPYSCKATSDTCSNHDIHIYADPNSANTLVKYFELYCSRASLISVVQASFFITGAFGIVTFSYLSDKVGRFPIIAGSFALSAITFFAASFSTSYLVFGILLAVCGIGINVFSTLCFVIIAESSSKYTELQGFNTATRRIFQTGVEHSSSDIFCIR